MEAQDTINRDELCCLRLTLGLAASPAFLNAPRLSFQSSVGQHRELSCEVLGHDQPFPFCLHKRRGHLMGALYNSVPCSTTTATVKYITDVDHIQRLAIFTVGADIIQHMLGGPVFLDSDIIWTASCRQTLGDPSYLRVES